MKSYISSSVVFICFFGLGILINYFSPQYTKTVTNLSSNTSPARDPAAIKRVYDFSNLEGSALSLAAKQRLIDGTQVLTDKSNIGVSLGHFVIRGDDGQKTFACQTYSKVIIGFEGDGMVVAGEKPQMEIEGSCDVSADINSIAPLWIPVAKILGEPVADGEFDFRDGKAVKVRFANVSDQWPSSWVLKNIRLVDPNIKGHEVLVDQKELRALLNKPIFVSFK